MVIGIGWSCVQGGWWSCVDGLGGHVERNALQFEDELYEMDTEEHME